MSTSIQNQNVIVSRFSAAFHASGRVVAMVSTRQQGIMVFIDDLGGDRFRVDVECIVEPSDQRLADHRVTSLAGWVACELAHSMSDGVSCHERDLLVHFVPPAWSPIQPAAYDWTRTASIEHIDQALQISCMLLRQRWRYVMRLAGELMHRESLGWRDIQAMMEPSP
jgi:hypothetical protein